MSFYHIKNIKIDKQNNEISADLADSSWSPLSYFHSNISDKDTFEEKYADFLYNLISGNFHPASGTKYSNLVMNSALNNYYDDVHDIGLLDTYYKYKDVIDGILTNDTSKIVRLESDRELNPLDYYKLMPYELPPDISQDYPGEYFINQKCEIFNFNDGKLSVCSNSEKMYGYPLYQVDHFEKYEEYNDFLSKESEEEREVIL